MSLLQANAATGSNAIGQTKKRGPDIQGPLCNLQPAVKKVTFRSFLEDFRCPCTGRSQPRRCGRCRSIRWSHRRSPLCRFGEGRNFDVGETFSLSSAPACSDDHYPPIAHTLRSLETVSLAAKSRLWQLDHCVPAHSAKSPVLHFRPTMVQRPGHAFWGASDLKDLQVFSGQTLVQVTPQTCAGPRCRGDDCMA